MLACGNVCIVLQLTPHLCPAQPVHVKCFLQTVYGLNAYEGMKTTNSLHLSERYRAEFKQTRNEWIPTWNSFHNIWIFRWMQSHTEHSAVKWESFFSLIMQTEHFNNEPSLWDPHCYCKSRPTVWKPLHYWTIQWYPWKSESWRHFNRSWLNIIISHTPSGHTKY